MTDWPLFRAPFFTHLIFSSLCLGEKIATEKSLAERIAAIRATSEALRNELETGKRNLNDIKRNQSKVELNEDSRWAFLIPRELPVFGDGEPVKEFPGDFTFKI